MPRLLLFQNLIDHLNRVAPIFQLRYGEEINPCKDFMKLLSSGRSSSFLRKAGVTVDETLPYEVTDYFKNWEEFVDELRLPEDTPPPSRGRSIQLIDHYSGAVRGVIYKLATLMKQLLSERTNDFFEGKDPDGKDFLVYFLKTSKANGLAQENAEIFRKLLNLGGLEFWQAIKDVSKEEAPETYHAIANEDRALDFFVKSERRVFMRIAYDPLSKEVSRPARATCYAGTTKQAENNVYWQFFAFADRMLGGLGLTPEQFGEKMVELYQGLPVDSAQTAEDLECFIHQFIELLSEIGMSPEVHGELLKHTYVAYSMLDSQLAFGAIAPREEGEAAQGGGTRHEEEAEVIDFNNPEAAKRVLVERQTEIMNQVEASLRGSDFEIPEVMQEEILEYWRNNPALLYKVNLRNWFGSCPLATRDLKQEKADILRSQYVKNGLRIITKLPPQVLSLPEEARNQRINEEKQRKLNKVRQGAPGGIGTQVAAGLSAEQFGLQLFDATKSNIFHHLNKEFRVYPDRVLVVSDLTVKSIERDSVLPSQAFRFVATWEQVGPGRVWVLKKQELIDPETPFLVLWQLYRVTENDAEQERIAECMTRLLDETPEFIPSWTWLRKGDVPKPKPLIGLCPVQEELLTTELPLDSARERGEWRIFWQDALNRLLPEAQEIFNKIDDYYDRAPDLKRARQKVHNLSFHFQRNARLAADRCSSCIDDFILRIDQIAEQINREVAQQEHESDFWEVEQGVKYLNFYLLDSLQRPPCQSGAVESFMEFADQLLLLHKLYGDKTKLFKTFYKQFLAEPWLERGQEVEQAHRYAVSGAGTRASLEEEAFTSVVDRIFERVEGSEQGGSARETLNKILDGETIQVSVSEREFGGRAGFEHEEPETSSAASEVSSPSSPNKKVRFQQPGLEDAPAAAGAGGGEEEEAALPEMNVKERKRHLQRLSLAIKIAMPSLGFDRKKKFGEKVNPVNWLKSMVSGEISESDREKFVNTVFRQLSQQITFMQKILSPPEQADFQRYCGSELEQGSSRRAEFNFYVLYQLWSNVQERGEAFLRALVELAVASQVAKNKYPDSQLHERHLFVESALNQLVQSLRQIDDEPQKESCAQAALNLVYELNSELFKVRESSHSQYQLVRPENLPISHRGYNFLRNLQALAPGVQLLWPGSFSREPVVVAQSKKEVLRLFFGRSRGFSEPALGSNTPGVSDDQLSPTITTVGDSSPEKQRRNSWASGDQVNSADSPTKTGEVLASGGQSLPPRQPPRLRAVRDVSGQPTRFFGSPFDSPSPGESFQPRPASENSPFNREFTGDSESSSANGPAGGGGSGFG